MHSQRSWSGTRTCRWLRERISVRRCNNSHSCDKHCARSSHSQSRRSSCRRRTRELRAQLLPSGRRHRTHRKRPPKQKHTIGNWRWNCTLMPRRWRKAHTKVAWKTRPTSKEDGGKMTARTVGRHDETSPPHNSPSKGKTFETRWAPERRWWSRCRTISRCSKAPIRCSSNISNGCSIWRSNSTININSNSNRNSCSGPLHRQAHPRLGRHTGKGQEKAGGLPRGRRGSNQTLALAALTPSAVDLREEELFSDTRGANRPRLATDQLRLAPGMTHSDDAISSLMRNAVHEREFRAIQVASTGATHNVHWRRGDSESRMATEEHNGKLECGWPFLEKRCLPGADGSLGWTWRVETRSSVVRWRLDENQFNSRQIGSGWCGVYSDGIQQSGAAEGVQHTIVVFTRVTRASQNSSTWAVQSLMRLGSQMVWSSDMCGATQEKCNEFVDKVADAAMRDGRQQVGA